jgi:hypothetical protein
MSEITGFIDYAVTKDCKNPGSYGTICVKCGRCGRKVEDLKPSAKLQAAIDDWEDEGE